MYSDFPLHSCCRPTQLLLSVIPGVCSDILRGYHNDWLGDIILIIYFTLR
jgi:hypothetical protein